MTFQQILNDLKNRIYRPVYFLHGEEPYFIDVITDFIADNVLSESEKAFNRTVVYAKDTTLANVIDTARRFPMMASHQVVVVKEAQNFKDFKLLETYMKQPMLSTLLVFAHKHKKIDKRLKIFKEIDQKAVLLESGRLYPNQIIPWVSNYLDERNKTIHPKASALINECLGNDLSRISSELNKLLLVLPDGETQISEDLVSKHIGIHRDFNIFELNKALGHRDALRAYQIVDYFAKDQKNHALVFVLSQLFEYFNKLIIYHSLTDKGKNSVAAALGISPFFSDEYKIAANNYPLAKLMQVMSTLRQADVNSKGVDVAALEPADIMKEMVFKILH